VSYDQTKTLTVNDDIKPNDDITPFDGSVHAKNWIPKAVLRILDVYPGSEFHPESQILDPHYLSIFKTKNCY
jgi:hypothetical protein